MYCLILEDFQSAEATLLRKYREMGPPMLWATRVTGALLLLK